MKNRTMRVAALLLVLTLMTSCFVGGTFAKYTTGSGLKEDTARVAKWGVTVTGTGVMFSDSYKDEATTYAVNEDGTAITVQSGTAGDKVIAPGTNGTLAAFDIGGTPEVDTEVVYTAVLTLTGWEVDGAEYCPIVFKVNGTEYKIDATNDTIAKLEAAVEAAIVAAKQSYDTNEDLSAAEDDLVVTWAWAFEGDDVKDTKLGDAAATALNDADDTTNAPSIEIEITCTINQVN